MSHDKGLPHDNREVKLAMGLLAKENQLDLQVLHALLGSPKRFRDLKPLVKGASDTPLTRTLHRLSENALIRQGMTLTEKDPRYYAVTGLGVHVALKAHEFRPLRDVVRELRLAGQLKELLAEPLK